MNVRRSLLLAALVALLATQGARGGFLDSVTEGLGNAVASVTGAVTGAAGAVANAATDAWDKVSGWSEDAWNKTKDTFVGAYQFLECKGVDFVGIDLDPCWNAPPSNPCTDACKAAVDKMPQACLDRIMKEVVNQGNPAVIDRLERQLTACGKSFSVAEGAALMAVGPFDASTPGCGSVDWAAVNATACAAALDTTDVACPEECLSTLGQLPMPCLEGIQASNSTGAVLLVDQCMGQQM